MHHEKGCLLPDWRLLQGKKSIHHHRGTPLFSVCRPTPKKAMVYTIFLGKQGKRVYTIGPERRVYTTRPQTQKKEKKRASMVVVYTFFFPAIDLSPCLLSPRLDFPDCSRFVGQIPGQSPQRVFMGPRKKNPRQPET